ncbi:glycoside hydrolase family 88 protein [Coniophora puteana RWD-64-598 SS2]|uniref:Glycoside hydrolase family 88 protein n=1 Tax=Coniophora puteana (strain RWD-64-598) TaxID=741705 RepID=A0A5M3N2G6_CONPW|nr:glycoside hydrolase family 88 protein [Coniophora puteana RWD-64-598 SS2]EIW85467.1 glycoside hydrolase family 88 protein [Coniophora puteana RWD-64-598 SS2]
MFFSAFFLLFNTLTQPSPTLALGSDTRLYGPGSKILASAQAPSELYSSLVQQKVLKTAQAEPDPAQYPQYTDRTQGEWQYFVPDTWTTGFFPATLYELNTRATLCNLTGQPDWVGMGRQWAAAEVPLETNTTVGHDVGFLSFPFAQEMQINPSNQTAKDAVNAFATALAARFNPVVGCTRSWDTPNNPTLFQVIIDNMMNLEVLFVSESLTGNTTLRDIAISHANKTMENHVRPDGSSFHLVEYNSTTGAVIDRITAQGYADNSTWSRGQAWGVYGFANSACRCSSSLILLCTVYYHTNDTRYLETSRAMATYFVNNLPSDGIVPWDFNAPLDPPRPADTSAATIVATGLLLLARQELSLSPANTTGATYWSNAAMNILSNATQLAWRPDWQSLLSNGTVNNHYPSANNDTGIVYGDYYYIKAGNDLVQMGLATCSQDASSPGPGSGQTSGARSRCPPCAWARSLRRMLGRSS